MLQPEVPTPTGERGVKVIEVRRQKKQGWSLIHGSIKLAIKDACVSTCSSLNAYSFSCGLSVCMQVCECMQVCVCVFNSWHTSRWNENLKAIKVTFLLYFLQRSVFFSHPHGCTLSFTQIVRLILTFLVTFFHSTSSLTCRRVLWPLGGKKGFN